MKKMILLEFNELCPPFIDRFIAEGALPNFKKLRDMSTVMATKTDATGIDLNPWVQWVDIHTGLDWQEHEVKELNEELSENLPMLWDYLSQKYGCTNWICGSMNTRINSDKFKGRFLPDPWNSKVEAFPPSGLQSVHSFVSKSVIGHSKGVEQSNFKVLVSLLKQGLKFSTVLKIVKQLVGEKLNLIPGWKRALILDYIQLDIFAHYYKADSPQFATFFSNTVAHYQHHYWKEFEPDVFGIKDNSVDKPESMAIPLAYKNSDVVLGKILNLLEDDVAIVLLTALSQEPYTKNDRYHYTFVDESQFLKMFLDGFDVNIKPVMAEQFHIETNSSDTASSLEEHLVKYEMDSNEYFYEGNNQLFLVKREKEGLMVQCRCNKDVRKQASFFYTDDKEQVYNFYDSFLKMRETKSGTHNQVGIYWSKNVSEDLKVGHVFRPSEIYNHVVDYFGK